MLTLIKCVVGVMGGEVVEKLSLPTFLLKKMNLSCKTWFKNNLLYLISENQIKIFVFSQFFVDGSNF